MATNPQLPIRILVEAMFCAIAAIVLYYAFRVEYFRGLIASWIVVNSLDALLLNHEAVAKRWRQCVLGIVCGSVCLCVIWLLGR
jgi:hypothetical protein